MNKIVQFVSLKNQGYFYIIEGQISLLKVTESLENDKADIAVCKLTEESVSDLKQKYDFLGFENIELDHEISFKSNYIIVGYPITKTKKNTKKRTIKSTPLKLSTKAYFGLKQYEKIGRDIKTNILFYKEADIYIFYIIIDMTSST